MTICSVAQKLFLPHFLSPPAFPLPTLFTSSRVGDENKHVVISISKNTPENSFFHQIVSGSQKLSGLCMEALLRVTLDFFCSAEAGTLVLTHATKLCIPSLASLG